MGAVRNLARGKAEARVVELRNGEDVDEGEDRLGKQVEDATVPRSASQSVRLFRSAKGGTH